MALIGGSRSGGWFSKIVNVAVHLLLAFCLCCGLNSMTDLSSSTSKAVSIDHVDKVMITLDGCGVRSKLEARFVLNRQTGEVRGDLLTPGVYDLTNDQHLKKTTKDIYVQVWIWETSPDHLPSLGKSGSSMRTGTSASYHHAFYSQIISNNKRRYDGGLPRLILGLTNDNATEIVIQSLGRYSFHFHRLYRFDVEDDYYTYMETKDIDSETYQCHLHVVDRIDSNNTLTDSEKNSVGISQSPLLSSSVVPKIRWYYYQEQLLHRNLLIMHNFYYSLLVHSQYHSNSDSQQISMLTRTPQQSSVFQPTQALQDCLRNHKIVFVGDSHMKRIAQLLPMELTCPGAGQRYHHLFHNATDKYVQGKYGKLIKFPPIDYQINVDCDYNRHLYLPDGDGLYHNLAADPETIEDYLTGKISANMIKGSIFQGLGIGIGTIKGKSYYADLVETYGYDHTWVFNSGHWDLRDVNVETYISYIKELFPLLQSFSEKYKLRIVWNAMPPFSYKQRGWNRFEHRSNEDIIYANEQVHKLCIQYNFIYVPYAESILSFASSSCDDHHYLCGEYVNGKNMKRASGYNILGLLNVDLLLHAICLQ